MKYGVIHRHFQRKMKGRGIRVGVPSNLPDEFVGTYKNEVLGSFIKYFFNEVPYSNKPAPDV